MTMSKSKAAFLIVLTGFHIAGCNSYILVEELSIGKVFKEQNRVGAVNLTTGKTITFNAQGGLVKHTSIADTVKPAQAVLPKSSGLTSPAKMNESRDSSDISITTVDSPPIEFTEHFVYQIVGFDTNSNVIKIPGEDVKSLLIYKSSNDVYVPWYVVLGLFGVLMVISPAFRGWMADAFVYMTRNNE